MATPLSLLTPSAAQLHITITKDTRIVSLLKSFSRKTNVLFCIRLSRREGKDKSKGRLNEERHAQKKILLPLKPVKFPQSSRELLKEGREMLKNRSVPLDGFRMVSVNRFICSRVLSR